MIPRQIAEEIANDLDVCITKIMAKAEPVIPPEIVDMAFVEADKIINDANLTAQVTEASLLNAMETIGAACAVTLAKDEAAKALKLPMREYGVRIMVTTRTEMLAETWDMVNLNAVMARLVKEGCYETGNYFGDNQIEGDQIAFIQPVTADGWFEDEIEVDLREQGEPFSWKAVNLVKELAKVGIDPPFNLDTFADFIAKAKALCKVQDLPVFNDDDTDVEG